MKKFNVRWQLVLYDIMILLAVDSCLFFLYRGNEELSFPGFLVQTSLSFVCVFTARFIGSIYQQIWRYGGIQCYIRLLAVDGCAFIANLILEMIIPTEHITFTRLLAASSLTLLCSLSVRMLYRYAYKYGNEKTYFSRFLQILLKIFAGSDVKSEIRVESKKTKVAIIGAGRVGVALAEELLNDVSSEYSPRCFLDISENKINRKIHNIPVVCENESIFETLKEFEIEEIFFALPHISEEHKQRLYYYYSEAGYKVKVYDYPVMQLEGSKRHIREFDIEDLLFRKPIVIHNDKTTDYYKDKVILITGGGGSIGSELCRQLAKMHPRTIIILDIYENGAYDVQQELRIAYKGEIAINIEIASITNERAMRRVFEAYDIDIVINAAAHKHVPLMEKNCIEAVENNVFGTKTLVDLCEEYGVGRFMMVSTDKAVNPTNVMGATKRMCEFVVMNASTHGKVKCSATRFGNVLGSAGSVIPLFKKQISNGGPITLTDKRIIRYFMTIPEAAQLVLESGVMAKNGELFVLDMGQPVKILDLAENMIKLSGAKNIEIIETGLRPGEKLYEELLVKTEELEKTENSLIFIEKESPLGDDEINEKLSLLKEACLSDNDEVVRKAMKIAVPTYKSPEEVNANAKVTVNA